MKLPPLSYHRAESVDRAIALLVEYQGDAKIIAGGQSLVPMLAYRLIAPSALVDIGRIKELRSIKVDGKGLLLGALTPWCDIESSAEIAAANPLLHDAISHVAHYQIRNRGTIGGSLAHCDPAAEIPAVVLACGGVIHVQGIGGARCVEADNFFQGLLSTDLQDDEIITAVELPLWPLQRRWGFKEFSRRKGDFAIAGVALHFEMSRVGCIQNSSIVGFGVGDRALVLRETQAALDGQAPDPDVIARALQIAQDEIDPPADPSASADYRRSLFGALLARALDQAITRDEGAMP